MALNQSKIRVEQTADISSSIYDSRSAFVGGKRVLH